MPPSLTPAPVPLHLRSHAAWQLVVLDPRGYRSRVGALLVRHRLLIGPLWTPFVRVRPKLARLADGAGEW